jgi:UTP:GlnB (protein PII) uridylyltransferase
MDIDFLPITDAREVQAFLARVPLVVQRERFTSFVLGFPHHYLKVTPPVEIIRHFGLVSALGRRPVASSLSREGDFWKLVVVAADRSFLFSLIAGSLSFFGANIVSAEAFGNTESVVLDTFTLADAQGRFGKHDDGRRFQVFLEKAIEGNVDLERELEAKGGRPVRADLVLEWGEDSHPKATELRVSGQDAFGLLHAITHRLSQAGCGIEIAHIATEAGQIRDTFYLTCGGEKLGPGVRHTIERALAGLAAPVAVDGEDTPPR